MRSILCMYTCSDAWWPNLRHDGMTFVSKGTTDSVGFTLEDGEVRMVFRMQLLCISRMMFKMILVLLVLFDGGGIWLYM